MATACQTIQVSPGIQLNVSAFTTEEKQRFDSDLDTIANIYTQYSVDPTGRHVIADLFRKFKPQLQLFAEAAKNDLDNAGVFQGVNATNGFGMTWIRPDFLVPTAQGRTFDYNTGATGFNLNRDTWYGLYHDGAVGVAYSDALYLRREVAVAVIGFIGLPQPDAVEVHAATASVYDLIDEVQWEINGKPLPIWNMAPQMRATDLKIYEAPMALYLEPAKQYRCQAKFNGAGNVAAMWGSLWPVGVAFVTADVMRTTQPTQPTNAKP